MCGAIGKVTKERIIRVAKSEEIRRKMEENV